MNMVQGAEIKRIEKELKEIRNELLYIKEHMVDVDTILTEEERKIHEQSLKEYREGKTTKLVDLKKELGR